MRMILGGGGTPPESGGRILDGQNSVDQGGFWKKNQLPLMCLGNQTLSHYKNQTVIISGGCSYVIH